MKLVPETGVEPVWYCYRGILSLFHIKEKELFINSFNLFANSSIISPNLKIAIDTSSNDVYYCCINTLLNNVFGLSIITIFYHFYAMNHRVGVKQMKNYNCQLCAYENWCLEKDGPTAVEADSECSNELGEIAGGKAECNVYCPDSKKVAKYFWVLGCPTAALR